MPALEPAARFLSMVAWSALFHHDDAYLFDVISSTKRKALSVAVHHVLKRHTSRRDVCGRGPQGKKRRDPAPFSWTEHVLRLNEKEFKQRCRLNYASFYKLCDILRPDLEVKDAKQAKKSRFGTVVPVEQRDSDSTGRSPRVRVHVRVSARGRASAHLHRRPRARVRVSVSARGRASARLRVSARLRLVWHACRQNATLWRCTFFWSGGILHPEAERKFSKVYVEITFLVRIPPLRIW